MTTPDPPDGFDPLLIADFFDARECAALVAELGSAACGPAAVYGREGPGAVDERVRRAARLTPSPQTFGLVTSRLLARKAQVEEHFGLGLSGCEEPQFLRYRAGDFFVAHQDGNTPLLRSEREQGRKVSAVVFLSRQSAAPSHGAYGGGSLVFSGRHAGSGRVELPAAPGTLLAFRPETTHEVTPVTHGERYSIACWYR